jgi:pyruvate kinase
MVKQTKIICTLGPSSSTAEVIQQLADAGMNIARINMSHGNAEQYSAFIQAVRTVNSQRIVPIGIMLDTKGAEIRTGERANPLEVSKGTQVRFCPPNTMATYPQDLCIEVSYDKFAADCKETNQILLDNGELSFTIDRIDEATGCVFGTAKQDGSIGSRRHINLFGALVDLPTITEKDWEDMRFAVEQNVDFIALSFIRTADDVITIRKFLEQHNSTIAIISKIETKQAVDNIHSIIQASDGVMVARGDLGAEIPYEQIPTVQDRIVTMCSDEKKPVIVATQMLESMREHPMPTRAEITDVAHAAMSQTDTTMLSAETASGNNPVLATEAMSKILLYTETNMLHSKAAIRRLHEQDQYDVFAAEICREAYRQCVDSIVLDCADKNKILSLSKQRPELTIYHYCSDKNLVQYASILYGTYSVYHEGKNTNEALQIVKKISSKDADVHALFVQWHDIIPSYSTITY